MGNIDQKLAKMTSLLLRRKIALVLANPVVRRKKEKENPKSKNKRRKAKIKCT